MHVCHELSLFGFIEPLYKSRVAVVWRDTKVFV
jgi:hypothetical protein